MPELRRGAGGLGIAASRIRPAGTSSDDVVQGKPVRVTREDEQEKKKSQTRDDVFVKWVQRLLQKVPEGHDDQHHAESQKGVIHAPPEEQEGPADELHERNGETDDPEGPAREKRVFVWQEPLAHVPHGSEGEDLEHSRHEEDEPQDEPREKESPGTGSGERRVHPGECSAAALFVKRGSELIAPAD